MRCLDVACTLPELRGEAGRIQGGPWQVWLAWTVCVVHEVGLGWWFRWERLAVGA